MKKKLIVFFLVLLITTGCENKEEKTKNEYISMRSDLLAKNDYTELNDLPLDITTKVDRVDDEIVKYRVILENPKENMNNLRAMVVPNFYNEDLYPSIGVFDEKKTLGSESEHSSIEMGDVIETTRNVSTLNLELKVLIQYTNDFGEEKEVLYKTDGV